LTAVDGPIDAGTYVVETREETIEGASFVGYRRISTAITIASKTYGASSRQVVEIDPVELECALKRDKEHRIVAEAAEANHVGARAKQ
jgi:hypothetical protein